MEGKGSSHAAGTAERVSLLTTATGMQECACASLAVRGDVSSSVHAGFLLTRPDMGRAAEIRSAVLVSMGEAGPRDMAFTFEF